VFEVGSLLLTHEEFGPLSPAPASFQGGAFFWACGTLVAGRPTMRLIRLLRDFIAKISVLILITGSPAALAEERPPLIEAWITLLESPDFQLPQSADRLKVTRKLGEFCGSIADSIPTLSPREQDWLDTEMNSPRIESVIDAIEFSKFYAGRAARNCLGHTKSLQQALHQGNRKSEALVWALLAGELLDSDFHWHVDNLRRKGVVRISEEDSDTVEFTPAVGQEILNKILVPHLLIESGAKLAPNP
jgi:hypothetical protein